jgi:hypothetical protein
MNASLYTFIIGLEDLRNYIREIELEYQFIFSKYNEIAPFEHEAILIELKERVMSSIIKWKTFNYNCIIISLYGYFEQYLESLLQSYIQNINKIVPKYSDIPGPIKNNQLELSIKLLSVIDQPKYRDVITKAQVISNLHSCINNHENYCINVEAFSYHTANFKRNIIYETFARAGIEEIPRKLTKTASFIEYLLSKTSSAEAIEDADLSYIDNLADRRNDVAHGVPTEDILSTELLLDYVNFFEAFGKALHEVASGYLLEFEVRKSAICIGKPIVVHNNNIVCIPIANTNIKVNDLLIAMIDNNILPYRWGKILEIQVNNTSYTEIMSTLNKINVALRVEFKAKDTYSYYLLRKE